MAKSAGRDLALSLSLANLCFFETWHRMLFADPFFMPAWSGRDLAALTLNVLLLAALFWIAMSAARRSPSRLLGTVRSVLPLLALLVFAELAILRYQQPLRAAWAAPEGPLLSAILALVAVYSVVRWRRPVLAAAEVFALSLVAFLPVTFGQAAWRHINSSDAAETHPVPAPGATAASSRRVVWIVFDEMDARPAFLARPAGLSLPNLDRLRAEALYAPGARQAGLQTVSAFTSIIAGRPVYAARPEGSGELLVSFQPDTEPREPFTRQSNLFSKAIAAGFTTAVVGWYFPYCRVLEPALTRCAWQPMDAPPRAANPAFAAIVAEQWRSLLPLEKRRNHRAQYQALMRSALESAADPSLGLVLIHLPVPHEPAIYDRSAGEFTLLSFRKDWYADNLALADRALGELRAAMERAGTWETSTVLVTADHSLRYYADFNTETDSRIPFLLKPAGPSQPLTYSPEFSALATHELLLAVLRGEITDTASAARWLDAHAAGNRSEGSGRAGL
ncbi:MAG TPA: alkaline phosphatase family protein [Terriglobales bacterium]|nr:alkaline phosphatase family protein [Terriglobales bacterium]